MEHHHPPNVLFQGKDPAGVEREAGGQRARAERDPAARGGGPQARDRGVHRADHEEQEAAAAQPAGHRGRWKEEDLHGLD